MQLKLSAAYMTRSRFIDLTTCVLSEFEMQLWRNEVSNLTPQKYFNGNYGLLKDTRKTIAQNRHDNDNRNHLRERVIYPKYSLSVPLIFTL